MGFPLRFGIAGMIGTTGTAGRGAGFVSFVGVGVTAVADCVACVEFGVVGDVDVAPSDRRPSVEEVSDLSGSSGARVAPLPFGVDLRFVASVTDDSESSTSRLDEASAQPLPSPLSCGCKGSST
jgi:hypothetical protein